jgi:hypothetical protein
LDSVDDGLPVSTITANLATVKSDVGPLSSEILLLSDVYDDKIKISNKTATMASEELATGTLYHASVVSHFGKGLDSLRIHDSLDEAHVSG